MLPVPNRAKIHSLVTKGPRQTKYIGKILGKILKGGEVICLIGELGSGKTCFTQGIALGLSVEDRYITSPTFVIINEYKGRVPLYHIDLYRIEDPEEIDSLGISEYFYKGGVAVIEWAEKAKGRLPLEKLIVELTFKGPSERKLIFNPEGSEYEKIIDIFKSYLKRKSV